MQKSLFWEALARVFFDLALLSLELTSEAEYFSPLSDAFDLSKVQ